MQCALCGYEYDELGLECHSKCPMADGCHIICCPNCGYQVVDESKSGTVALVQKIGSFFSRPSVFSGKKEGER